MGGLRRLGGAGIALALATVVVSVGLVADEGRTLLVAHAGGQRCREPAAALQPNTASPVRVQLERVARVDQATSIAARAGDTALYATERQGRVVAIDDGVVDAVPVVDLTGQVTLEGEDGLLGLTFSPGGTRLYLAMNGVGGSLSVLEFPMIGRRADPSRRRTVLRVEKPTTSHNGGDLAFGPDGHLYVSVGDGAASGDPFGNAQNTQSVLGSILRIDPTPDARVPYRVPADNPFVRTPVGRDEIWDYGLRNPWRLSFDRDTGDLWLADVGEHCREEVDVHPAGAPAGQNFGWNYREGSLALRQGGPDLVPPVLEYDHGGGACGVVGGYVYRGAALPALSGWYVFADLCTGGIWAFSRSGARLVELATGRRGVTSPVSFGEDNDGELYVASMTDGVHKLVPDIR